MPDNPFGTKAGTLPGYNTAFEEAATSQLSSQGEDSYTLPAYITAADTLNVSNSNQTFLESAMDTIESIPKFIGVSAISGASQLYNIPVSIGNLFYDEDDKIAEADTSKIITDLDSDLGQFYDEHQEGADLVGFLMSSMVPGLGGVKILNAGQKALTVAAKAGKLGANMSKATKLLAPSKELYLAKAVRQVVSNAGVASFKNREAVKALAAGFGQTALETAAFETAVATTMFDSPMLDNYDMGDFVTNVAIGAGLFGAVGTALHAAKINSTLKKAADTAAIEARPWQHIPEYAKASAADEKLAIDYESINAIPNVPTDVDPSRYSFLTQAAKTKDTTLQNRIRESFGDLAEGDQLVAEVLYRNLKTQGVHEQQSAVIGLKAATRLKDVAAVEKDISKISKRIDKSTATPDDIEAYLNSTLTTKYVKMWGDDTGTVYTTPLRPTALADTLRSGEYIKVKPTTVKAGSNTYKFSMTPMVKAKSTVGHFKLATSTPLETNARYIWAMEGAPKFAPTANKPVVLHADDIPMLEKAHRELSDTPEAWAHVSVVGTKKEDALASLAGFNIQDYIATRKIVVANKLLEKATRVPKDATPATIAKKLTQDEIAAMVNIKPKVLNGELEISSVNSMATDDMFAMQAYQRTFMDRMIKSGVTPDKAADLKVWHTPQQIKATYDTAPFKDINNHVIENMAIIKERQKLYKEGTDNASAFVLGEDYEKFIDLTSSKVFSGAKPSGAGASRLAAANGDYGSLANFAEYTGSATTNTIAKFKAATHEVLDPLLYKLAANQEASIEWSTLNARLRSYDTTYAFNEAGDALEPLAVIRYREAKEAAEAAGTPLPRPPRIDPSNPEVIRFNTEEARNLAKAHIETNGKRTEGLVTLRAAQGVQMNRDARAFYPIPPNSKDYPFFAIVTDDSVTSGNASSTLYANSAEELETMIRKVRENPQLTVRTKKDAEDYFKSRGRWDYEKSISDNYINTELRRKGVSAPTFVATDPQKIVADTINWHMDRETGIVREAVSAKYEVQFEELRRLGDEYTNIDTSQFSKLSTLAYAEDVAKNPFADYIRTALGIGKQADYPFWTNVNQLADKAVSRTLREATKLISSSKSQADLDNVDALLRKAGYKGAAYDEEMDIFVNARAPRGTLTKLVRNANSVLATVVLRLDTLNAVNNAVSANVLLGAETKAVVRAIQSGDAEAVGALASLTRTRVPGTSDTVFTPTKLIANAVKKFGTKNSRDPAMAFYRENGFIGRIADQYTDVIDDLTYNPAAGAKSWEGGINKVIGKLRKAGDVGEKLTGNRLAEEFNRFVAADVMKQMTDVAVTRGLMSSKEQLAYIRTFVNRTQGNYLASQRPNLFQGPVGQALGLFQTYQFNLIQQLLRYVGEGKGKDAMTLLALQGTIHGMNGLPAFNAINTHIVGNASGNTEHKDFYTSVYGIAGKEAGDWLMYGAASNSLGLLDPDLKVNLYTRGDINPRHLTIIPTDPSQVPIIQATARFMSNIKDTFSKIQAGGDVYGTLLQGIEHNGLSRPLAGLAQTMQAFDNPNSASYSTSNRGNVVGANDLLSLTNLVRMVGGKPLDEAIAIDQTYRSLAYSSKEQERRQILGEALKTKVIAGKDIRPEEIEDFAKAYAEAGGRQEYFNRWAMDLYKNANLSQTNAIMAGLDTPFSRSMQRIMGGIELRDFADTPQAHRKARTSMHSLPVYTTAPK